MSSPLPQKPPLSIMFFTPCIKVNSVHTFIWLCNSVFLLTWVFGVIFQDEINETFDRASYNSFQYSLVRTGSPIILNISLFSTVSFHAIKKLRCLKKQLGDNESLQKKIDDAFVFANPWAYVLFVLSFLFFIAHILLYVLFYTQMGYPGIWAVFVLVLGLCNSISMFIVSQLINRASFLLKANVDDSYCKS